MPDVDPAGVATSDPQHLEAGAGGSPDSAQGMDPAHAQHHHEPTSPTPSSQVAQGPPASGQEHEMSLDDVAATLNQGQQPQQDPSQAAAPDGGQAAQAPPANEFLEMLAQEGFEGLESPEEGQRRLIEAFRRTRQEREAYERQMQEYMPLVQIARDVLQQRQQQPPEQAQQPQDEDQPWWNPPKFDRALIERYRELDESGQPRWKPDTPLEYRQAYEEYVRYHEDWQSQLLTNPAEAIPRALAGSLRSEAVANPLREIVREVVQDVTNSYQRETTVQSLVQQNADWIFQRDPVTKQLDNQRLTPIGQRFAAALENLQGIPDPQTRFNVARDVVLGQMYTQQQLAGQSHQQQVQAAQQQANANHVNFIRNTAAQTSLPANRTGALPQPSNPTAQPAQSLSFEQQMLLNMQQGVVA